jgi:putative membrane protein (TIGR04086 family)
MARPAAKTAARPATRPANRAAGRSRPSPSRPAAESRPGGEPSITLKWPAILGGLAIAYIASVAMGVVLAKTGLAGNLTLFPFVQFLALFAGGYVAGRWAGVSGFMNGVAVAVAFIVVWAVQNAVQEAQLVDRFGPLALPRMNIPGILLGDVLNLSAAAFGGWLAERKRG